MKALLRTAMSGPFFLVAGFLLVSDSIGQISLTESTIVDLVDKQVREVAWDATSLADANTLRDNFGPDRVWDVTGIPFILRDTTQLNFLSSIAGTVGAAVPEFAGANVVSSFSEIDEGIETHTSIYWTNFSDAFRQLGAVQIGEFFEEGVVDTVLVITTPAQVQFTYPFSFETIIADSVTTQYFAADTLIFEQQIAIDGEVDGWGSLITPAGQMDVLRYRFERRTYSMGVLADVSVDIEWWNDKGLVMGMEIDESGNGADLSYFDVTVGNPTSTEDPGSHLVGSFSLESNYPNPFFGSTTVPFDLSVGGQTRLVIYDMLGRQVDILVDGHLPAGRHEVRWSSGGIAAGLYQVTLGVHGKIDSRSVVLLR